MKVDTLVDNTYSITLSDDEETIVTEWAHLSHTSNEEVIEDWLTTVMQIHKLSDGIAQAMIQAEIDKAKTEGIDDG